MSCDTSDIAAVQLPLGHLHTPNHILGTITQGNDSEQMQNYAVTKTTMMIKIRIIMIIIIIIIITIIIIIIIILVMMKMLIVKTSNVTITITGSAAGPDGGASHCSRWLHLREERFAGVA